MPDDAKPSPKTETPSNALVRTEPSALRQYYDEHRVSIKLQEWGVTGGLVAVAVQVAVALQAWLEFTGFPTHIGMVLAILLGFILRGLAMPIVYFAPFTVSDRTPHIWPSLSRRRILAYVVKREQQLMAEAEVWNDGQLPVVLIQLKAELKSELTAYKKNSRELFGLQRKARNHKDVPQDLQESIADIKGKREKASENIYAGLAKYDGLLSKYASKRTNAPPSQLAAIMKKADDAVGKDGGEKPLDMTEEAEVKAEVAKLEEDALEKKIDALEKKPPEPDTKGS